MLQVPTSPPHPTELFDEVIDEATPYLPIRSVIAPGFHEREVPPPPLPYLVVPDASVEVNSGVGVHPVPIDLLE